MRSPCFSRFGWLINVSPLASHHCYQCYNQPRSNCSKCSPLAWRHKRRRLSKSSTVDLATRQRMWLQQNCAPPHFALIVREFLNLNFNERYIVRGGLFEFSSCSPDLTSLDFFLWGYIHLENWPEGHDGQGDVKIYHFCEASWTFVYPGKPRQFRKRAYRRFSDIWPQFFTFPKSQKPFFHRSFLTWNLPLFSNPQSKIGVLI